MSDTVNFTNAKFGEVTVEASSIMTFPEGVPGFERLKRYGLVQIDEEAPFLRLLSLDEPAVAFVILNPMSIWAHYDPRIGDDDLKGLGLKGPSLADDEDLELYCIVTLSSDPKHVTANLKGPITINTANMTARQIILVDDRYTTKHSLLDASKQKEGAQAESR
jgi:flagellar assembly factor FliW